MEKVVLYDEVSSGNVSGSAEYGKQTLLTISPWISNIKTDTGKIYEIRFFAYIVCEDDENKVGIIRLKILRDDETEYLVGDWAE